MHPNWGIHPILWETLIYWLDILKLLSLPYVWPLHGQFNYEANIIGILVHHKGCNQRLMVNILSVPVDGIKSAHLQEEKLALSHSLPGSSIACLSTFALLCHKYFSLSHIIIA